MYIYDCRSNDLKLGLNQQDDYHVFANDLGTYLYFGFLPLSVADAKTKQGLTINGQDNTVDNCGGNGSSYLVLSPNFEERALNHTGSTRPFCQNIFTKGTRNPSGRLMPQDFFMFAEMGFGGCGCLTTTNNVEPSVVSVAIGFR